jgi:hypothetical protein
MDNDDDVDDSVHSQSISIPSINVDDDDNDQDNNDKENNNRNDDDDDDDDGIPAVVRQSADKQTSKTFWGLSNNSGRNQKCILMFLFVAIGARFGALTGAVASFAGWSAIMLASGIYTEVYSTQNKHLLSQ